MTGFKVVRTQMRDGLRSRWVLGYGLLLALMTEGLLRFGGSGDRALLSLLNVVLILLPLVSLVFGTMYLYHARNFIELLLTQPISRRTLFGGLFGGVTVPLVLAYLVGVGAPFLWHGAVGGTVGGSLVILLGIGVLLTVSCTAIAFYLATRYVERATGLGAALLVWIVLTVLYDGLLLFLIGVFGETKVTGKPRGADLTAGKNTSLVRVGLTSPARGRKALEAAFGKASASPLEVSRAIAFLEDCGAKAKIEARIDALAVEALSTLESRSIGSSARELLKGAVEAFAFRAS